MLDTQSLASSSAASAWTSKSLRYEPEEAREAREESAADLSFLDQPTRSGFSTQNGSSMHQHAHYDGKRLQTSYLNAELADGVWETSAPARSQSSSYFDQDPENNGDIFNRQTSSHGQLFHRDSVQDAFLPNGSQEARFDDEDSDEKTSAESLQRGRSSSSEDENSHLSVDVASLHVVTEEELMEWRARVQIAYTHMYMNDLECILVATKNVPALSEVRKMAKKAIKKLLAQRVLDEPLGFGLIDTNSAVSRATSQQPSLSVPFEDSAAVPNLAKKNENTFVMDLLPGVVGWVIGRAGTRIKEIQGQSGCKMWVDQDVPDDQPRKLYFHGNKSSIDNAIHLVNDLLQSAPILAGKHGQVSKLTSHIMDCPPDLVGLLIGKKGWTIKKIQQESGAQISINQSVREGLPRKIIISGTEDAVRGAICLIEEVLKNKQESPPSLPMHRMLNTTLDDQPLHIGASAHSMQPHPSFGARTGASTPVVHTHSRSLHETHSLHSGFVPQSVHVSEMPPPGFVMSGQVSPMHGFNSQPPRHDRTSPQLIGQLAHSSHSAVSQSVMFGGYVNQHYHQLHGQGQPLPLPQNMWPAHDPHVHNPHNGPQYASNIGIAHSSRPMSTHRYSASMPSLEQAMNGLSVSELSNGFHDGYDGHLGRQAMPSSRPPVSGPGVGAGMTEQYQQQAHASLLQPTRHRAASDCVCDKEWRPSTSPSTLWQPSFVNSETNSSTSIPLPLSLHVGSSESCPPSSYSYLDPKGSALPSDNQSRSHSGSFGELQFDQGLEVRSTSYHNSNSTSDAVNSDSQLQPDFIFPINQIATPSHPRPRLTTAEKLHRAASDTDVFAHTYEYAPSHLSASATSHSRHGIAHSLSTEDGEGWGSRVGQLF